jgi:hypothetical protein
MDKKQNRVTYEELSGTLSHFEIAYLAFFKASDILRSGRSLIPTDSSMKPKVAVVAYEEICADPEKTIAYKEELMGRLFVHSEEITGDAYTADDSVIQPEEEEEEEESFDDEPGDDE